MNSDYAIQTIGLEKVYRSRWRGREIRAVSDLSLRVPAGVKFGLLGANGAGKTTFVKMLLSAVNPTAGTATIFGRDAREPEARRPVGYLPENHRFPTYLTGSGMLHFYGSLSGMDSHDRARRVPELLEQVGLKNWGDVRIRKFSKGMLQRLGLAQALIHRPRLLVLDEPTDGVDPVGRRQIRDILSTLTCAGVTVFINSHLLSEVETFCDYVAILKKGQLALEGKMSELLAGRGYRVTGQTAAGEIIDRQLPTREEANRFIDQIRAGNGWIEAVAPTVNSLEDLFILTTGDDKAA
ncbi:MAG TPA: ABC transporter ATP-binding protein [Bryobacteraceae bacterium]|nr:ABC transporter ATP-binding protein [Bryobacteraceae bacterium]